MTKEEAIEQFKYAIDLIRQDGKDYLDERDIPMLEMGIQALENQKTGHWVKDEEMSIMFDIWTCSECGCGGDKHFKYCAHCGAKMEGG